jgi:hypothetical protein
MNRSAVLLVLLLLLVVAAGGALLAYRGLQHGNSILGRDTYEVEVTDVKPPPVPPDDLLTDDTLEDKSPPAFDPALVDRRPLGPGGEWLLDASAAVVRLDVPIVRPDVEPQLLTLHPSYAAAAAAVKGNPVLPSVNLVDGKAKQFDDGLYAALDRAYYRGLKGRLASHVELVRHFYDKAGKDSPAAAYLAAGLELAGVTVEPADRAAKEKYLRDFRENEVASKPIGFYTWDDTLATCFRFLRFFQKEFGPGELAVPADLARALAGDQGLRADYRKMLDFYAHLTNPYICLSVADLPAGKSLGSGEFVQLCHDKKVTHETVALFPPSTSRETVLFEKLFRDGLPPNADLMRELVQRIRSGEVDLQPRPDSGWYDYQAYALETLLLPGKGQEKDKLLLTRAYKKRMLEAFQALITKRKETHVRQLAMAEALAAPPLEKVSPPLRVEPCPTYFLRTARAYAFLGDFLEIAVGRDGLKQLHGLTKDGERPQDLGTELRDMRDLFYGLYLVSAEDIGMKPQFRDGEPVQADRCYRTASAWLETALGDRDLAEDTRVAVPVVVDPQRQVTRLWLTLGVRLAKLDASYARPPSLKPAKGQGDWRLAEGYQLGSAEYLIPVDEFAEVELPGLRVLTREELRSVCDREKTKDAILQALRQQAGGS